MKMFRIVAAALFAACLATPALATAAVLAPGAEVPEIELKEYNAAAPFLLSSFKDKKAVVFEFSNSACGTCVALTEYLKAQPKSDNYELVMVNVDRKAGTERWNEIMKQIVAEEGLTMRIVLDPSFKTAQMFGVSSTPGLVVIDKSGKLVKTHVGFADDQRDEVKKLLESAK